MKTISITLDEEDYAKLSAIADVLNLPPGEFLSREGLGWITQGMAGTVAENLAARIYDTQEEAERAASKADALDEEENDWHFYRMPDGRIQSEVNDYYHADRIAEGCELIKGKVVAA